MEIPNAAFFHGGIVEAMPGKFVFGFGAEAREPGWDPFLSENELPYAFAALAVSHDVSEIRVVRDAL